MFKRFLIVMIALFFLWGCPDPIQKITVVPDTTPEILRFEIPSVNLTGTIGYDVSLSNASNISRYYLTVLNSSDDAPATPSASSSGWNNSIGETITVDSHGSYTAYLWIESNSGSIIGPISASFRYIPEAVQDSTAPTMGTFTVPATTANADISVTVAATDDVAVTAYYISAVSLGETAPTPGPSAEGWLSAAPTTFDLPMIGEYTLFCWAKDAKGNISTPLQGNVDFSNAAIESDVIAPTITSFYFDEMTFTGNQITDITLSAMDDNLTGYMITESPVAPTVTDPRWSTTAPTTYDTYMDKVYTLYGWAKDAAGNISQAAVYSGLYQSNYNTVIIYYGAADNDLEEELYNDLNEMEMVDLDPVGIKTIALFDRGATPGADFTGDGDWTDTRAFEVGYDASGYNQTLDASTTRITIENLGITDSSFTELNMDDPNVLSSFIGSVKTAYPAENYILILSNHGGGWRDEADNSLTTKAICWDDTSGEDESLYMNEVRQATVGKGLDLIAFDACLMGMVEVLYEMKDSADYLVASEELVPGFGFPYYQIYSYYEANYQATMVELGSAIVDIYIETYEFGGNVENPFLTANDVTLSLYDTSAAVSLAGAVNNLGAHLLNSYVNPDNRINSLSMAGDSDYVDLGDYIFNDPDQTGTAGQAVQAALNAAILHHGKPSTGPYLGSTGLAIYFPPAGGANVDPEYNATNISFAGAAPDWFNFLDIMDLDPEVPELFVLNADTPYYDCTLYSGSDVDAFTVIPSGPNQAFLMTMPDTLDIDLMVIVFDSADNQIDFIPFFSGWNFGDDELYPLDYPGAAYYVIVTDLFDVNNPSWPESYNVSLIDLP